ncbi:MAG: M23 family metallopeptidase [Clostridiales bacterium]|nr:M23 family metallopeptidase [Clostridiales bacterium]
MNKKLIAIVVAIAVVAIVALGFFYAYLSWKGDYEALDASGVPVVPIEAAGHMVYPESASVTIPVNPYLQERYPEAVGTLVPFFGLELEKSFDYDIEAGADISLGILGTAPYGLEVVLPEGMEWSVSLGDVGQTAAAEPDADPVPPHEDIIIQRAGDYALHIVGTLERAPRPAPYGTFSYTAYFSLENPPPVFTVGRTELAQGDILSLRLENVEEGIVPELETELGMAVFTKGVPAVADGEAASLPAEGFTNWYATIPISNTRTPGEYHVSITAGELSYEATVTVSEYDFDFQNLIIDTSVPSVAAAVTPRAIEEFREKVIPLFSVFTEERYWDGMFVQPVDLEDTWFISTQFGEIRITNGNPNTRRSHNGIDYALPIGWAVHATGAGKVLLSEFLLNTGYTIVIDHGGGLISIYYHLDTVDVEEGAFVEQGEFIATVGNTGYSTGPHLHFEMRIGDQPISPSMLFDPNAGLYSAG